MKIILYSLLMCELCMLVSCTSADKDGEIRRPRAQQTLEELYMRGKSERIQGLADECIKTYSKIIDLRKMVKDNLYAYSLYQLGLCYEMKNQNARAIAVYQDALRVRAIVNSELANIEIPSRLAITYSRMGENEVADKYFKKTKEFIEKLKQQRAQLFSKKEYYAEVLFQMGTIANQFSEDDHHSFESYLRSIRYSQDYLMLVLELNVSPYAEYALRQIVDNFSKTFEFIKNIKAEEIEDTVLAERWKQQKQKDMSELLLEHIDNFEASTVIEKKSNREDYNEIFKKLHDIKQGLESIIKRRPVGEGLTPEAQKLQNPKKEGKFIPVEDSAAE